jgi:hypothetical protein
MAIAPFAPMGQNNPVLSQPATKASPMMQAAAEPDAAPEMLTNPVEITPEQSPEETLPQAQPDGLPKGVDPGVLTRLQRPQPPAAEPPEEPKPEKLMPEPPAEAAPSADKPDEEGGAAMAIQPPIA